jgi:hypothetical protein
MSDNILNDLRYRISVLEAVVLGRRDSSRPTDPQLDRRLTKRQLALRRGKSTRTVDRDVERGLLPPPEIENGRCYWWLSTLERHDRERVQSRTQTPPNAGKPAARREHTT